MKQLAVRNGDLAVGPSGLALVEGSERVSQDLRIAVLEPYGEDRFHPRWGSTLHTFIGPALTPAVTMLVSAEVQRVITNYALAQRNLLEKEISANQARRTTVEIIKDIVDISTWPQQDRLWVSVSVTTMAGTTVQINSVVAN